jgi:hypothetical protein
MPWHAPIAGAEAKATIVADVCGNCGKPYFGVGFGPYPNAGSYWGHVIREHAETFETWAKLGYRDVCDKPMRAGATCARTVGHADRCRTSSAMGRQRALHKRKRALGTEVSPSGTPGNFSLIDDDSPGVLREWRKRAHGPDAA